MLIFLADENFNGHILKGLRRRRPEVDIVRVCDEGLGGESDQVILDWAARHRRVLLTHDVSTMTQYAHERIASGLNMPGIVEVPRRVPVGQAIDEVLLLAECCEAGELEDHVLYLPLR